MRVRAWHPLGHAGPRGSLQGKQGQVVRVDRPANLPDLEAHGGRSPRSDLFGAIHDRRAVPGEGGAAGETVHVDLWERYLEAAG